MYVSTQAAMHKRRMLESPSCAIATMQHSDLANMGRLTGPPIVTLGDVTTVAGLPVSLPAASASIFTSPYFFAGAALLLGLLWYRSRSTGGILSGVAPRRRRTKRI